MKEPEKIACRICWLEHSITEPITCPCGNEILPSQVIRETITKIDRNIKTLLATAVMLHTELWSRERRKTSTDSKGQLAENFWKGLKNAPRQEREKKCHFILSPADIADFQ